MGDGGLYVPIQVGTPWNRKLLSTDSRANWLWFVSICYCKQQQSDGFFSEDALRLFPLWPKPTKARLKQLVKKLVDVGLWERVDDGFRVHDFLAHNLSRTQLAEITKQKRAAGALGGHQRSVNLKRLLEASGEAGATAPASLRAVAPAEPKRREEK